MLTFRFILFFTGDVLGSLASCCESVALCVTPGPPGSSFPIPGESLFPHLFCDDNHTVPMAT